MSHQLNSQLRNFNCMVCLKKFSLQKWQRMWNACFLCNTSVILYVRHHSVTVKKLFKPFLIFTPHQNVTHNIIYKIQYIDNKLLSDGFHYILEVTDNDYLAKSMSKILGFLQTYHTVIKWLLGTRRFLSWAMWIKFTISQPTSLKSILIFSSHLHLSLPKDLFPSGLPTKTLYAFLDCSICVTCPAHSQTSRFNIPNYVWHGIQCM